MFENFLATAPNTASNDTVRQSIVILMGNLARHLDSENPKVKPIVAQLVSALSTPSQEVSEPLQGRNDENVLDLFFLSCGFTLVHEK